MFLVLEIVFTVRAWVYIVPGLADEICNNSRRNATSAWVPLLLKVPLWPLEIIECNGFCNDTETATDIPFDIEVGLGTQKEKIHALFSDIGRKQWGAIE